MSPFHETFMVNALLGGTGIALACGLVGYFLVLRAQVFTGDALSHVAFTGSLAALAFDINLRVGLFAASIGIALLLGALGRRGRADDVVIGNVFAWILGLGVFFLTLYTTDQSGGGDGTATVSVLFGSVFGLTGAQPWVALGIGAGVFVAMTALARPLLFASIDEAVASARGVPVRLLAYGFLALVGATTAEASQAVGALLLLGLLAAPAGTALLLTDRPFRGMAYAAGLALAEMWAGLLVAYYAPRIPPSFSITAVATAVYAVVLVAHRTARRGAPGTSSSSAAPAGYADGNRSVKAEELAPSP